MANLSLKDQIVLDVLKQLEYRCDSFLLQKREKMDKNNPLKITAGDIELTTAFDKIEKIYDVEKYLQNEGLDILITFDFQNDILLAFIDDYHPSEDSVKIGEIRGKNIESILEKIKDMIYRIEAMQKRETQEIRVLTCNGLKFDLNSGDVSYGKTKTNFKPEDDGYKLLSALMKKPNIRISYEEINKALGKNENSKKDDRDISFIIRNIRKKMGIGKNNGGNKNIFIPCNGYRIECK
jgi:hypothetical protein